MNRSETSRYYLIARYFDGSATEEELKQLLSWVKESEANLKQFLQLRNIWFNTDKQFDPDEIDVDQAELNILEAVGIHRKRFKWMKRFIRVWERLAAVLLLPIVLVSLIILLQMRKSDVVEVHNMTISTVYGCSMETTLPDGSHVWLNANSRIVYPSDFGNGNRHLSLVGEAFFDVQSDAEHPFSVEANNFDVRATGTEFNINAYEGSSFDNVILVEGSVDVSLDNNGQTIALSPGQKLSLDCATSEIMVENVSDMERLLSWRKGILEFDGETLSQIMERISQIYRLEYNITDEALASRHFHATFSGENIPEIMRLLELASPMKCEIEEQINDNGEASSYRVTIFPAE